LSVGAVYVPLERMVAKGWLVPEDGAPSPVRGGRRRRYYRLTPAGAQALRAARNLSHRIWAGKPARLPTRQERAKAET
jgi:DNA-binding PadR family transcriptional regulator